MTVSTLSERDVQSIVRYWCNGATDKEIVKWTGVDRPGVLTALSRVVIANDLISQKELLDYDADELLYGYERYAEEAAGKPENHCLDHYKSYPTLVEASKQFLILLNRHHGNGVRASG